MHHKRKKAKRARAGCLMCKPHKINGGDKRSLKERALDERLDEPQEEFTPVICRVWAGGCHHPELCQEECWDEDLVDGEV